MSERPFMQLYVSDFIGDTLHLSSEQVGAYLLLLMAMWNADGKLQNDEAKLARVARLSLKKWRSVAPDLMPFFEQDKDHISHRRLTKELQKSERQSQSRSAAGVKGFAAKVLKNNTRPQANAQAGLKHSPEPYRKKAGNSDLVGVPTDGLVDVNRNIDAQLFAACVALTSEKVPSFIEHRAFPASLIARAKANIAAQPVSDGMH
jgi:uncharacterized protein YdaU (DUF1376 family)